MMENQAHVNTYFLWGYCLDQAQAHHTNLFSSIGVFPGLAPAPVRVV